MTTPLRLLPIILVGGLTLILAAFTYAQTTNETNSSNFSETGNLVTTQTLTGGNLFNNFDWRWFLPVLLIPAGLLLLRGSSSELRKTAGSKFQYQMVYHDIWNQPKFKAKKSTSKLKPLKSTN